MASYLVTGAAGFIGSKVSELLLREGHTVVGVDNLNDAYDVRLKEWRLARLQELANFVFDRADITDKDVVKDIFAKRAHADKPPFAAVINLAARAGVRQSVECPRVYFETNVQGTLNLLQLCDSFRIPKFVLASSSSLYGISTALPYAETDNTDRPLSPYAASKKAAEALCYSFHYLTGIDVTVLRYFTVYGPAGRPDMLPFRLVQWISEERCVKIYGDGSQSRDFTYVDDIARGTIAALRPVGYEIVNLGSDSPVALQQILHMLESLIGKRALIDHRPAHPADVPKTWADIRKARQLLGWAPETDVDQGLEMLVSWYRSNREWTAGIATD